MAEQRFWTGDMIRTADLPRAFRGLDEKATRALLEDVAASVDASTTARMRLEGKRLELSKQVEALLTVVAELEAAVSEQSRKLEASRGLEQLVVELERELEERDLAAAAAQPAEAELAELVSTASRTVEELLARARSEAARVTAEASSEAERLLEDARSETRRTQDDVADLRRMLDENRDGLVESVKAALATQEPFEPAAERGFMEHGFLEDSPRPSTAPEQSPFSSVAHSHDDHSDHSGSPAPYGSDH